MDALEAMRAALGDALFADAADNAAYLTDWRGSVTGAALAVLLPRTTADVQRIVRLAGEHGVALVPQGGNTSMVAGAVPEPDGQGRPAMLVSLKRMNRILAVDPQALSMEVEAGAILQTVQEEAVRHGCRFPLSLGAKGSATVGGLVSTNAGGVQVLRHGNMRSLVLGLEAVLADGQVLNQISALRKDNTGYDIKQLLIGGEGTLGIVTRVALKLSPEPAERSIGWAGVSGPAAALALLGRLRAAAGETVESFEIIDRTAHDMVIAHMGVRSPLESVHGWHVLIDLGGPAALLESVLADAIEAGDVADAVVAQTLAQGEALWALRENIPEAERRDDKSVKSDISVAVNDVPAFQAEAVALMAQHFPAARPIVFGHLGDGNLHWNIRPPVDEPDWAAAPGGQKARAMLHDLVTRWHGSISAEHGIGRAKLAELARLGDPAKLSAMRAVKAALDPAGIFNPGKLLS